MPMLSGPPTAGPDDCFWKTARQALELDHGPARGIRWPEPMVAWTPIRRSLAAFASIAVSAVAPTSALATIPAGNLLKNPGGEQGTVGWDAGNGIQTVFYGTTSGYPGRDVADGFVGGCQFFSGGPSAAQPAVQTATQTVAFSEAEPEIKAGTVTATLSAYLGGYLTQADNAKVEVMLRDASGGTVGSIPLAPVTAAERANQTTLVRRAATLLVPTTARSALIVLTATRTGGDANDGYADNLSFSLDGSTPGPPSTACLPDLDGDKFDNATDCNDNDASIHPGAADVPEDGIDQDCAGGDAINLDRDRDGYNRPQDCADGNAAIHPGAADVPEDGIDQDCAGGDAINLDRDRDGYNRPQDCNDAGAGVHPGATDTPGNGVDEDCSGKDAAFPRITSPVTMRWSVHKVLGTRVLGLTVKDAPEGAKVRVSCTGRGCPPKVLSRKVKHGALLINSPFNRRWLRPGAVVEIRVSRADMVAEVVRYKIRSGGQFPKRSALCLAPGAKKVKSC